jgi:Protein of unknown function (DUF3108)
MHRALLVLLLLPACASLEPIDPGALEDAGDLSSGTFHLPVREVLRFRGTWNGIPAGEGRFRFERKGDVYLSSARVETIGLVALLYGVEVSAKAESGIEDLLSRKWSYETTGGDPDKRVEVRFIPGTGKVLSVIRQPDKVDRVTLDAPGLLDPLGTIYAIRRSDLEPGMSHITDLFTERNLYRATTLVVKRERVKVPAGEFDCVLIRVDFKNIEDGTAPDKGRAAAVWLTDDENRTPVRIDMDTKIGRIKLSLTEYERGWPKVSSGRGTRAP